MDECVGQEGDLLHGLPVHDPKPAHDGHGGVVKDVKERQRLPFQRQNNSIQELDVLGEVIRISDQMHRSLGRREDEEGGRGGRKGGAREAR